MSKSAAQALLVPVMVLVEKIGWLSSAEMPRKFSEGGKWFPICPLILRLCFRVNLTGSFCDHSASKASVQKAAVQSFKLVG